MMALCDPNLSHRGRRLLFAVSTVLAALALPAQEPAARVPAQQGDSTKTLAYEVVSVKPHKDTGNGISTYWRTTANGFSTSGNSPDGLIMGAYGLVMPDQIINLPAWAASERFDIEAKMDEDTVASWKTLPNEEKGRRQNQMMQALLADRFQLKVHHETRDLPVYQLTIAKGGLKMKEAPTNSRTGWSMGSGFISSQGMPISNLSASLSNEVGRFVVNKTGLSGNYEFTLKWALDEMRATAPAATGDSGPSIFTALEEQLGLKLVSAKGPVDVIVVDRIERPTEN